MTKSKFAADSETSSNEDDSSSHSLTSSEEDDDDDDDESERNKSIDLTQEDDSKPSTKLDESTLTGLSSLHEHNSEVLDDLFPGIQSEILLIVTYEMIIFVDNAKRDQPILEIKHEDLLYVMGKKDILKIAFQMNQNLLSKEKQRSPILGKKLKTLGG